MLPLLGSHEPEKQTKQNQKPLALGCHSVFEIMLRRSYSLGICFVPRWQLSSLFHVFVTEFVSKLKPLHMKQGSACQGFKGKQWVIWLPLWAKKSSRKITVKHKTLHKGGLLLRLSPSSCSQLQHTYICVPWDGVRWTVSSDEGWVQGEPRLSVLQVHFSQVWEASRDKKSGEETLR